jgi:hypothetical protein
VSSVTPLKRNLPVMPKPDTRAQVPHPEDWDAWCQHPVTRFVATAMQAGAELQRQAWIAASWGQGASDQDALNTYRTRADAYMAFLETDLESYAKLIEQA